VNEINPDKLPSERVEYGLFASIEIEHYADNPYLVRALRDSEVGAQATIAKLTKRNSTFQNKIAALERELSSAHISHARATGDANGQIGQLKQELAGSQQQLADLQRQSGIAVLVALIGSILVGIGTNLITGQGQQQVGLVMLAAGVVMNILAFFVPRRSRRESRTPKEAVESTDISGQ
jgi:hypothetical protein